MSFYLLEVIICMKQVAKNFLFYFFLTNIFREHWAHKTSITVFCFVLFLLLFSSLVQSQWEKFVLFSPFPELTKKDPVHFSSSPWKQFYWLLLNADLWCSSRYWYIIWHIKKDLNRGQSWGEGWDFTKLNNDTTHQLWW